MTNLIPFGKDRETGKMISVDEVKNGKECNCICPKCGGELIAKQGDIKQHHFAHKADSDCQGALETSIHKMAKQIIEEKRLFPLIISKNNQKSFVPVPASAVVQEQRLIYGDKNEEHITPDLIALLPNYYTSIILIEIFVSHPCDERKKQVVNKIFNYTMIEINLSKLLSCEDLTKEIVEKEIFNPENLRILNWSKIPTPTLTFSIPWQKKRRNWVF